MSSLLTLDWRTAARPVLQRARPTPALAHLPRSCRCIGPGLLPTSAGLSGPVSDEGGRVGLLTCGRQGLIDAGKGRADPLQGGAD